MNVLVTGGTGALGRQVVKRLLDSGHRPRILSRRPAEGEPATRGDWVQGDLVSGAGLELAVKDIDAIIHAASDPLSPRKYQAPTSWAPGACWRWRARPVCATWSTSRSSAWRACPIRTTKASSRPRR